MSPGLGPRVLKVAREHRVDGHDVSRRCVKDQELSAAGHLLEGVPFQDAGELLGNRPPYDQGYPGLHPRYLDPGEHPVQKGFDIFQIRYLRHAFTPSAPDYYSRCVPGDRG